ncbi:hypothetical protein Q4E93_20845 [Flavitalea sp. BT771]|uniref:hypothetical protein n=1 Tax=Flavitalea sp. BT771 TaxID=3063329 RepID=UPI0026E1B462|nr:hypothetical protein [Flavitalea sp. BT771]MDO6433069.1 hypothetical protein [Flavitalea sp. BT771]MDV6221655.1 hypothetical protein [Flavitalea sp. BT771]
MKTLMKGAILVFATLGIVTTQAQSVDEIIGKHIQALGGKTVLNAIKSVYVESTVEIMGNEAPSITYILNGKGYKNELDFNGTKIIQCVTEKGGWAINPMAGSTTAQAIPADQLKNYQLQLNVGGPLMDYATKGYKAELIGKDSAAYKIRLTTTDGINIVYFVDQKTYLIDKAVNKVSMGGQDIETTAVFSDYKKTDAGYVVAYSQQVILPQVTLNIINKKVELNKEVDPAIFEMPKN